MGKIRGPIGGTYITAGLNYAMSSNPTLLLTVFLYCLRADREDSRNPAVCGFFFPLPYF